MTAGGQSGLRATGWYGRVCGFSVIPIAGDHFPSQRTAIKQFVFAPADAVFWIVSCGYDINKSEITDVHGIAPECNGF